MKGLSVHQQARDAGVSPAVVIEIRRDRYGYGGLTTKPGQSANEKKEIGWAQSLTRLALYANRLRALEKEKKESLSIPDVLTEFGIDTGKPSIERAVTSVEGQVGQHGLISDPVLRQIALRKNFVNTGILQWPPFYRDEDKAPETSWAWKYTRRLLGSINPIEWRLNDPVRLEEINEAVDALGAGSSKYDLVFGIYDTPYRRLRGLDFLHLPGLAVPLALVYRKDRPLGWEEIVRNGNTPGDMKAIVLHGEVGHLFLIGPCQFREVEIAQTYDIKTLVSRYVPVLKREGARFFFCADRTMCRRFLAAATKFVDPDPSSELARVDLDISVPDQQWAPNYRLGFAVTGGANRWLQLLKDTQTEELFRNAMNQTTVNYAQLLATAKEDLELISLTPDLSETIAENFATRCASELNKLTPPTGSGNHAQSELDDIGKCIARMYEVWSGAKQQAAEEKARELRYPHPAQNVS